MVLAVPVFDAEVFAGSLGVALAVLLVGSSFALRWQRNRQRFELARAAIENGATGFAAGPPFWLASLREGLTTLTLGLALLGVGAIGYHMGGAVPAPTADELRAAGPRPDDRPPPPRRDEPGGAERPGPRGGQGGPPDPLGLGPGVRGAALRPPAPNPAIERWHRAQATQTVGLLSMGCGLVLTLLGLVRAAFARVERHYAPAADRSP